MHAQFRNLQWHQSHTLYCHATAVRVQYSPLNRKNIPHNAPKVAIWRPKIEKIFMATGHCTLSRPPVGREHPLPTPTRRRLRRLDSASAFGAWPPQTLSLPSKLAVSRIDAATGPMIPAVNGAVACNGAQQDISQRGMNDYASAVLGSRNSACLSVTCVDCGKTKWRTADILIPHEMTIILQQWLVGDAGRRPFRLKFALNVTYSLRNTWYSRLGHKLEVNILKKYQHAKMMSFNSKLSILEYKQDSLTHTQTYREKDRCDRTRYQPHSLLVIMATQRLLSVVVSGKLLTKYIHNLLF